MRDWIMMLSSLLTMALVPAPALTQEGPWEWAGGCIPAGGCGAPEDS